MAARRVKRLSLGGLRARRFGLLRVKTLRGAKGGALSILHVSLPPGGRAPALRHLRTDEFFLVLKGSSSGRVGGRRMSFKKGDGAFLPAGTWHEFRAGPRGVELLDIFCPALDLDDPDIVLAKR